jgi:hypothetical protein
MVMSVEQSVELLVKETEVFRENLLQCCFVHHSSHEAAHIQPLLRPGERGSVHPLPMHLYGIVLNYLSTAMTLLLFYLLILIAF